MATLYRILFVTNSWEVNPFAENRILKTLNEIRQQWDVQATLAHIIPKIPTAYYQVPMMELLESNLFSYASYNSQRLGEKFSIANNEQYIIVGHLRTESMRLVRDKHINQIMTMDPDNFGLPQYPDMDEDSLIQHAYNFTQKPRFINCIYRWLNTISNPVAKHHLTH